jgi:hypothetical protein
MKKYGQPRKIVTDGLRAYCAAMKAIGNSDRQEVGRALTIVRRTRISRFDDESAPCSVFEDAAKIQLSSRPGPQPFESGAPSRHPSRLQAQTLCRIGRVVCSCELSEDWDWTIYVVPERIAALTMPSKQFVHSLPRPENDCARVVGLVSPSSSGSLSAHALGLSEA